MAPGWSYGTFTFSYLWCVNPFVQPEMEMVARGLEKHLKVQQREFLMDTLVGVCGKGSHRSMAEALGLVYPRFLLDFSSKFWMQRNFKNKLDVRKKQKYQIVWANIKVLSQRHWETQLPSPGDGPFRITSPMHCKYTNCSVIWAFSTNLIKMNKNLLMEIVNTFFLLSYSYNLKKLRTSYVGSNSPCRYHQRKGFAMSRETSYTA